MCASAHILPGNARNTNERSLRQINLSAGQDVDAEAALLWAHREKAGFSIAQPCRETGRRAAGNEEDPTRDGRTHSRKPRGAGFARPEQVTGGQGARKRLDGRWNTTTPRRRREASALGTRKCPSVRGESTPPLLPKRRNSNRMLDLCKLRPLRRLAGGPAGSHTWLLQPPTQQHNLTGRHSPRRLSFRISPRLIS